MNAQKKSTHTPGPWQVNRNDLLQICDSDGEVRGCAPIADVIQTGRPKPRAVDLANARLIAAAPDLLDALRGFVDGCQRGVIRNDVYKRTEAETILRIAIAAIAKATGETP